MSNSINNIFDDFVEEEKEVVEEEKVKSINVFDIVNSIYYDRSFVLSEETKKYYTKYMINKSLSMGQDTIHFSNEMNRFSNLTNEMHLGFLNGVVRKRKRYNKWAKSEKIEHIDVVKFFLKCSNEKAKNYLSLLDENQIASLQDEKEKILGVETKKKSKTKG